MRLLPPRRAFPFLLGAVVACRAVPAPAQTRDQIRERDEQLYQQNQDGSSLGGSYASPPDDAAAAAGGAAGASASGGGLTAQLLDRVSSLEARMRDLQGRVDELQQQLSASTAALNKQIGDLSFQVQQGGGGTRPGASPAAGGPSAVAAPPIAARNARPAAPPPRATPEASLRAANVALARHDYAAAADAARAAAAGPHAADAEYALGSAYAGQRNYQQAAVSYYAAYAKNPRGPIAPAALLHVGTAMSAAGQTGAACEALGKLRAEFPSLRGGVASGAGVLRRRLHC